MKWSINEWGPSAWKWLHNSTISEETILLLPRVLPCSVCRYHIHEYMQGYPITRSTSDWLQRLHNNVNRRTGKPLYTRTIVRNRQKAIIGFTDFMYIVTLVHGEQNVAIDFFRQGCRDLKIPCKYKKHCTLLSNIHRTLEKYGINRSKMAIIKDYIPTHLQTRYKKEIGLHAPVIIISVCIQSIVLFGCIVGMVLGRKVKTPMHLNIYI